jgi:hypothetical protein
MIDRGLPKEAEEWPVGVLEELLPWEQGDLVAWPPFLYFADPARAIWAATHDYRETSDGPEVILPDAEEHIPPYGMVTTQTCDIGEEGRSTPSKPWVQIAPVYATRRWKAHRFHKAPQHLMLVPDLPGDEVWVVDFRIEVPVEKGWLASQERVIGFNDARAKRAVGPRIAMLRGRVAVADSIHQLRLTFEEAVAGISDGSPEEQLIDAVDEVVVLTDSPLNPTDVQFAVLTKAPLSGEATEWLSAWWDSACEKAANLGLTMLPLDVRSIDELRVVEYRRMIPVWHAPATGG